MLDNVEDFFKSLEGKGVSPPRLGHNQAKQKATELIANLKYAQRSSRYLFRGLSRYDYDLKPSIARERHDGRPFEGMDEKIVFMIVKTEGMMFIDRGDLSDIDLIAMSQHFGAPTRLLDWTTNPLVALYFSIFSNQSSRSIDSEVDGIVYIYKSKTREYIREKINLNTSDDENPLFPDSVFSDRVGEDNVKFIFPRFVDARIKNQNGLFSVQRYTTSSFVDNCDKSRLWYLRVPKEIKVTLARYLYGLGITRDFIMPGFEGFCNALSYRYHYNVGILSRQLEQAMDERGETPPDESE